MALRYVYDKRTSHLIFEGESVTSIPSFIHLPLLQAVVTVVLPAGLRDIGDHAFEKCTSLREIELNEGIESIGAGAFVGCTSIARICIPSTVSKIGARAFNECTSLIELQLCEGHLREIDQSFQGCTSLERITFPSTLHNIWGGSFDRCITLKELHLCEGIKRIDVAFQGCTLLATIHIPSSLELIGTDVRIRRDGAPFANCTAITNLVIPATVDTVGLKAFNGCTSLENVQLCDGVRHIFGAFQECTSLTTITIPSSIVDIHAGAFDHCSSLTEVNLSEGIEILGPSFQRCLSLRQVNLPSTIKECVAFSQCSRLEEIRLSEGLQSIFRMRACAFTHVNLPSTVVKVVDGAFNNCNKLEEIHMNEGLQIIDGFNECISLKSISIPSTVATIDSHSFWDCDSLTEVHLCEGLETIDQSFRWCISLTQISIPSTVSRIDRSFINCFSLVEVHLCEGIEIIHKATFRRAPLLHLNIPSTVNDIELDAFQDCSFLRNIAVSPSSTPGKIDLDKSFKQFLYIDCSFDDLRTRFDGLPIHRACFYLSHESAESDNKVELLKNLVVHHADHCAKVDCLGMTPLHVLTCSAIRDLGLYQFIIDKNPDAMNVKDKWGEVPLVYLLISGPPIEIIHYFLETHRRKWGAMPFDFSQMILSIAYFKSAEYVRRMVRTLLPYFSGLVVNWAFILDTSMTRYIVSVYVFRVLVEFSVSTRANCMSTEHRDEIDDLIDVMESELELGDEGICTPEFDMYRTLYRRVTDFVKLHSEFLMNVSTNLELALWRLMLTMTDSTVDIDDSEARMNVRANCGNTFQVVIPNVLSYL